jgi:hypothetical protein
MQGTTSEDTTFDFSAKLHSNIRAIICGVLDILWQI